MNNNNNNNANPPAPAGSATGSVSDTLKGYVHSAYETAKGLGHQVHEQLNPASAQKTTGQAATHNASAGTQFSQNHPIADSGNAFSDLDHFNAQANQANQPASQTSQTANQASAHPGYKSSQSGL
ncbi:hypothetical protein BG006_008929 [Podila minutissima]|uniref:Uncharacterized protein n=1 Tax=Podila minutissima TaxID=64525 RepID=A0A9P5SF85_9FUNG|nr:hypothetical protein BG006_008929 [Podila minutissima]